MAKFLDSTGTTYLWSKIKGLVANYLPLTGGTLIGDLIIGGGKAIKAALGNNSVTLDNTGLVAENGEQGVSFDSQGVYIEDVSGDNETTLVQGCLQILDNRNDREVTVRPNEIYMSEGGVGSITLSLSGLNASEMDETYVFGSGNNFYQVGGKNGIASLDNNGYVPLSQLGDRKSVV